MPRYITPTQYRLADDGVPNLATLPDMTLARYIERAEAAIDAYVGFPLLTNNGFAPGILSIVQQGFDFSNRKLRIPTPIVPVRNVTRIRIHISNSGPGLDANGNPQNSGLYADLIPGEVVINNWEGYVEIIALTLTYSMAAVVWELGLNPPIAEWDLEAGFWLPRYGATLYDTGDATTYRATRGFWAATYDQSIDTQANQVPPTPPVIYLGGVPQFSTTLTSALTAGTAVTTLTVTALSQALSGGTQLVVNDGTGGTAVVVTLAAPAAQGATTLSINAFTPAVSYAKGTALTSGYSVNYTEGTVTFTTKQAGNPVITADFTATIPDLVHEAVIDQVTYLLIQRGLNLAGMGGIDQARTADGRQVRRAKGDDAEEDQLCAKARLKLQGYRPLAIA
jgi:hypothetical protein